MGEDAAIVRIGNGYMAIHTDPITGAVEGIGWLAINIVANDIAVRGIKPRWFLLTLLLPHGINEGDIEKIMIDVNRALAELNGSLIGGHTEITPGIDRVIASTTAIGVGEHYVTTSGAKPGDLVLVTKYIALEGTAVLATDFENELVRRGGVPREVINRAKGFVKEVSVVREALEIADLASAMHDPTEGGLLQGLLEIAEASDVKLRIDIDKVPILPETRQIFSALNMDPLASLSSGALVATIPRERIHTAGVKLSKLGINYSIIGEVVEGKPSIEVVKDDRIVNEVNGFIEDDVMGLWHRKYGG
ncbi:AIR synthase family protein [Vulcanisaeta souniana]|uniref:AIR synthase family protein n=1 Tax=Vulcanisaeta souniana TaxID=164452 RepID=UPI000A6FE540|nr:AIR synthase family protein [Vulcanisaeta souniana]